MEFVSPQIEICRCDLNAYDQFASLHYLSGICKGASCFMLKIDGEIGAFASLLALPLKGCSNALIFHRIVVLERFQGMGLSILIVNLLGGIYRSVGKTVYLKTDSKRMGKMLKNNIQWKPTLMNCRTRKLTKHDHERNKARHRRAAFSYRYEGESIKGYERMVEPVKSIREREMLGKYVHVDTLRVAEMTYGIDPVLMRDALKCDFDALSHKYEAILGCKHNPAELYSTDVAIRRKRQNMAREYSKRLLFINGLIHRVQHNSSKEAMIYTLLKENHEQNCNLRSVEVIKLAIKVFNTDISRYAKLVERIRLSNRYRVNVEVARERGLSPKQASNIARKQIRAERIAKIYRPDMTDEENIRFMTTHGLIISISTLKRWRKENGYTKYNKSVIPTT